MLGMKFVLILLCSTGLLASSVRTRGSGSGSNLECAADIAFVVDSSSSIWIVDFDDYMKVFMEDFVELFTLGENDVQFSSLTFGSDVEINYKFNSYNHNLDKLQTKIQGIKHMYGGNTQTYRGLQEAREKLFTEDAGARDKDVPRVIILFSDGGTNPGRSGPSLEEARQKTLDQANVCKNDSIVILTVGVGSKVNDTELRLVASKPAYYKHVASFSALGDTKDSLSDLVCRAVQPTEPPNDEKEQKDEEKTEKKCKGVPADVIFVLDASTSIGTKERFDLELSFVSQVVNYFDIGENDTQVGLMIFSDAPEELVNLGDYNTKEELQQEIKERVQLQFGNTYTDKALERLISMFEPEYGGRTGVKKIGVVLTDGQSTDPWATEHTAANVHANNITMFAIGIGLTSNKELKSIASTPSKNFVFEVTNLTALESIKSQVAYKTCESGEQEDEPDKLCKAARAEFIFVLDASTSIGQRAFQQQLDFLAKFTSILTIESDESRVAVVTFSDNATLEFNLDKFSDRESLSSAIEGITYTTGLTNTHKGLQMVISTVLPKVRDVPKVLVLITDGKARYPREALKVAEELEEKDVKIITVGVGPYIDHDELDDLSDDVLYIEDYAKFKSIINEFKIKVCEEASSSPSKKSFNKDEDRLMEKLKKILGLLEKDAIL